MSLKTHIVMLRTLACMYRAPACCSDDYIIVGGTREKGVDDQDVVQEVQDDILKRAAKLLPQIKVWCI